MTVAIVGSLNPVKIQAALKGIAAVYGESSHRVQGVKLEVPFTAQPMSLEETLSCSRRRAIHSAAAVACDIGIGMEGGLAYIVGEWFCVGCVTVVNQKMDMFSALSPAVSVPSGIMDLIGDGLELGDAVDQYYGLTNAKQGTGLVGVVTGNHVTREQSFLIPVISALYSLRAATNGKAIR